MADGRMTRTKVQDFHVLVVDDDLGICTALEELISTEGYDVTTVASAEKALKLLTEQNFPLVLSDIMMPGMNGIEMLEEIKSISPETIVVMMTGYSSIKGAITAIKAGAQDYLIKPIKYDDILLMLERNLHQYKKNKRAEMLRQELLRNKTTSIIGSSAGIKRVKDDIAQVAPVDLSVLITGESGTGKELVARALHDLSPRNANLFVAINCASIPSDLLESELFGHERGAFSGAIARKYGLFEVAEGGTILLDEIGEMPLELQSKILRTIETGTFRRVGGTQELSSNFRLISSTNRDLQAAIKEKQFRSDLFFRLNQFHIEVPPLRDRKSDIPLLVDFLATKKGRQDAFSNGNSECLEMLKNYHWPGNIRELFNALERAFLLSGAGAFLANHFPADITGPSRTISKKGESHLSLAELEAEHILKVYDDFGHNRARVAKILGISSRTLYTKLKDLNIAE